MKIVIKPSVCLCVCLTVCLSVQACKYAMRVCAPVLGSEQITNMFQNHLHEEKCLHYGEFINDLVKYLVSCIVGHVYECVMSSEKLLCTVTLFSPLDASPFFL